MIAPRFLLALVGAVCAGLLAEGAARLHGDVLCTDTPGAVFEADARFGWRFVPGASGTVGPCSPSPVPRAPFDADSHGLAGPERSYEKPPGTVRVLLLGGNLPSGLGVPPEMTLARLLERFADPHRGPRLEVVNGGIGGFALDNDLQFFRTEGRRFAPDVVVVVLDAPGELLAISSTAIVFTGQRIPVKPFFTIEGGILVEAPALVPLQIENEEPKPNPLLRHLQVYRNLYHVPSRSGPPMQWAEIGGLGDVDAERARERAGPLARALLATLRDETTAAGARLVALIAPQGGTPQRGLGWQLRTTLRDAVEELDIPLVDPAPAFSIAEAQGWQTYMPGTGRWTARGHLIATVELWHGLREGSILPPGVVQAPLAGATGVPSLRELPAAVAAALHAERWTLPVRFVVYGLLAVCFLWMVAPGRAAEREWLMVAVSVLVIAALTGPRVALGALGFAVVFYGAVERMPRLVGSVVVALLCAGLVLGTIATREGHVPGEDTYLVIFLALAGNVALLRLIAYAMDRARGAPRAPLRAFLLTLFYFPTWVAGPIESVHGLAARAATAAQGGDDASALAPLRAAPAALLRLALGGFELLVVLVLVNKITADVFVTGGSAFGRARLWLWVGELTVTLTLLLAGWTNVAIALGTLAGLRPAENFRAPWRALDVADFWRRWHVSLERWLHDYVYVPLGGEGRPGMPAVIAVFVASGLWCAWGMIKVLGFRHYGPGAWSGFLVWGLLNAAAVIVAHRRRDAPPPGALGAALRTVATLAFVSLAWIPFFLPGWESPAACVPIYLRLFFLR